jgi:hypothetical protein
LVEVRVPLDTVTISERESVVCLVPDKTVSTGSLIEPLIDETVSALGSETVGSATEFAVFDRAEIVIDALRPEPETVTAPLPADR